MWYPCYRLIGSYRYCWGGVAFRLFTVPKEKGMSAVIRAWSAGTGCGWVLEDPLHSLPQVKKVILVRGY